MQDQASPLNPIEIDVARLPTKGRHMKISVSAEEISALVKSFSLSDVTDFKAELHISRWRRDGVNVEGELKAKITQPCVVTLEPVTQIISEDIAHILVPEGSPFAKPKLDDSGELVLDPEGADLPDTFEGTVIDLSRILLEVFALVIDPHPRAEGVSLDDIYKSKNDEDEAPLSPFAVLAQLKNGKGE